MDTSIEFHDWGAIMGPVRTHRRGIHMEDFVTRYEHEQFEKRVDDAFRRTEKKVDELSTVVEELRTLPMLMRQVRDFQEANLVSQKELNRNLLERIDAIEKKPLTDISEARKTTVNTVVKVLVEALVIGLIIVIAGGIK